MNLLLWGVTFGIIGKIMLGIAVLHVHIHIRRGHTVDALLPAFLKHGHYLTIFGIIFIIIGFICEVLFYTQFTHIFK